jgi:hypothetical protein
MTFSKALISGKGCTTWKVRVTPSLQTWWALSPLMVLPLKVMVPPDGRMAPETMLKQVVLPAPFGPMRPTISPSSIWKERSSTAVRPPK